MTQRKYTTARHSLSVLHFLTAGYVSLRPRAVGIDGAGQQRRQVSFNGLEFLLLDYFHAQFSNYWCQLSAHGSQL